MWKVSVVVVLLLTASLFFIEFGGSVCLCDGGYDLDVRLNSASQTPINAVHCGVASDSLQILPEAFKDLKAERLLAVIDPKDLKGLGTIQWETPLRPFESEPIAVFVPTTDRISIFLGRELGYYQAYRALIIVVEY